MRGLHRSQYSVYSESSASRGKAAVVGRVVAGIVEEEVVARFGPGETGTREYSSAAVAASIVGAVREK